MSELLRFHLTALGIQAAIGVAALVLIGFTVLDQMSSTTAQLTGWGVVAVSQLIGYGVAIQRLRRDVQR